MEGVVFLDNEVAAAIERDNSPLGGGDGSVSVTVHAACDRTKKR